MKRRVEVRIDEVLFVQLRCSSNCATTAALERKPLSVLVVRGLKDTIRRAKDRWGKEWIEDDPRKFVKDD